MSTEIKKPVMLKVSGNIFEDETFIKWLRELSKKYHVVISIGGGKQINEEFEKKGYPIVFGPLGRSTDEQEHRECAKRILEKNRDILNDKLSSLGINAQIVIPFVRLGYVDCPVNGDLVVLIAYIAFHRIYVVSFKGNGDRKRSFFTKLLHFFSENTQSGKYVSKIRVKTF